MIFQAFVESIAQDEKLRGGKHASDVIIDFINYFIVKGYDVDGSASEARSIFYKFSEVYEEAINNLLDQRKAPVCGLPFNTVKPLNDANQQRAQTANLGTALAGSNPVAGFNLHAVNAIHEARIKAAQTKVNNPY